MVVVVKTKDGISHQFGVTSSEDVRTYQGGVLVVTSQGEEVFARFSVLEDIVIDGVSANEAFNKFISDFSSQNGPHVNP